MGRELKRVPMDFDWPLDKVWSGYINDRYKRCPDCDGTGSTTAGHRLSDLVSLLMLSGSDATQVGKVCHPYFNEMALYNSAGKVCGPDMLELTTALAGRAPSFMGHDCCDRWSAVKKIVAAAGLPDTWGVCAACKGEGGDDGGWVAMEPPSGDGYQVWENVSEGSPISPVCSTPAGLATWMSIHHPRDGNYEQWLAFITGPGWAPSMVMDANGVRSGVQA